MGGHRSPRTLLVDNYDSYTFNLYQLLAEVNGAEPVVVHHDTADWAELASGGWDAVVISPGPGRPDVPGDFGLCADLLADADVPVLGVCLGHQGIAIAAGGRVEYAEPMHGRRSRILHDGTGLFAGIPQGFRVVRYHSLVVAEPLPADLVVTARTMDGRVMGLRHRHRPHWGVQFHPESVATEHGRRILENFRDLTRRHDRPAPTPPVSITPRPRPVDRTEPPYAVHSRVLDGWCEPEAAFAALYAAEPAVVWLDSGGGRFSFLCAPDGPLGHVVTYDVSRRRVTVRSGERTWTHEGTLFDFLRPRLARGVVDPGLPFDFTGGYVGCFGYELKADCGGDLAHRSPHPDAALVFADRFLAFDHDRRKVYLVALGSAGTWFDRVTEALRAARPLPEPDLAPPVDGVTVRLTKPRERYLADIGRCLDHLAAGESYEICLTDRVHGGPLTARPFDVYRVLRRINPAPHAAYLRFPGLDVLCSSPERFLRIDRDRWIEAKPIKGTAPRSADPAEDERLADRLRTDEKTRAENLMIVDLLRNDIGAVSEIGSVHVPSLMAVESYPTVHQLVSTVRGRLRPGLTSVDCLATVFPGGSMTGAPKRRSMRIIDRLEGRARGIYSGAIGYLSLNGTADLNIVIRTIVADRDGTTIGTGGAIVAQSDPADEYAECLLKARAPVTAIAIAELNGTEPGGISPDSRLSAPVFRSR